MSVPLLLQCHIRCCAVSERDHGHAPELRSCVVASACESMLHKHRSLSVSQAWHVCKATHEQVAVFCFFLTEITDFTGPLLVHAGAFASAEKGLALFRRAVMNTLNRWITFTERLKGTRLTSLMELMGLEVWRLGWGLDNTKSPFISCAYMGAPFPKPLAAFRSAWFSCCASHTHKRIRGVNRFHPHAQMKTHGHF